MRRIAFINSAWQGSSFSIANDIAKACSSQGFECLVLTPHLPLKRYEGIRYEPIFSPFWDFGNKVFCKLDGSDGFRNKSNTKKIIACLKAFKPDIVNIHTVHGHFLNLPLLIGFLTKSVSHVVITMHDDWYFTGRCGLHPQLPECNGFITGCGHCKFKSKYPVCWAIDRSAHYYDIKKRLFSNNSNLNFTTVSEYMKKTAVKTKILENASITVIYNGVDLSVFKPGVHDERFNKLESLGKKIVIGIANPFGFTKGIDMFNELADRLDQNEFQVVLVGRPQGPLNPKIIELGYLNSSHQIAALFGVGCVLANTSRVESFGLVSVEAQACGTPVVAFGISAIPETINDGITGHLIKPFDLDVFCQTVIDVARNKPLYTNHCVEFAKTFDKTRQLMEYVGFFQRLLN